MSTRKYRNGPRALASSLPRVTKDLFRARGFAKAEVLTDWPEIAGRPLGDHTCPERLGRDGTLELRVSGGWALEIKHLEPVLLERIASYFGYRAVTRLALVQGPLPPRATPRRRHLRPLDAAEETSLRARLAGTDDADLRGALDRLGRSMIGATGKADAGDAAKTPRPGGGMGRNDA